VETFKLSWRNVWRNQRRSIVTIAAMTLALFIMTLYSGFVSGMLQSLERNVLDYEMGDVQIFHKDYQEDPSLYSAIHDPDSLVKRLTKAGYPASARLLAAGLGAAADNSAGVTFRGVNVEQDKTISLVYKKVEEGKWLDPGKPGEVVIGKRLARTLNVRVGDEIVVLSQASDGSMANDVYRVRGILTSVSDALDRTGIYMTEEAFRELFVMPEGAHQVIVRRHAGQDLVAAAADIEKMARGLEVKTWKEILPTLGSMLESTEGMLYVMFLIVYIAIGIVILNAMLMAVFERIREFGVLKALGMGPGRVLRLIIMESAIMTGLAILAGGALSVPGLWYLTTTGINMGSLGGMAAHGMAFDPVVRAAVTGNVIVGPPIVLAFIVFVAILYPAIKAAMIRPIEAIYHK
jgi:putative ABC transport system permease protein